MTWDMNTILAMIAVILGVLIRALAPWLAKKKMEGGVLKFKLEYTAALVISIIVTVLAVIEALSVFTVPEGGLFAVAIASFVWGFGFESAVARMVEAYLAKPSA